MERLWVIEDSREQVELIKIRLHQMGWKFDITSFPSGEKMLDAVRSGAELPKFMILDLGLPGEYGLAVLQRIKSNPALSSIPVIILTASNETSDLQQSYKLGGTIYMKKPLDSELLHEVLSQLKVTGRI